MNKSILVLLLLISCLTAQGQMSVHARHGMQSRNARQQEMKVEPKAEEPEETVQSFQGFRGPRRASNRINNNNRAEIDQVLRRIADNMVSIPESRIKISRYEITQGEWRVIMKANPSMFKGDDLPVENVSIEDCEMFISRLNKMSGKRYRLPTRKEWLKAATGSEDVMLEDGKKTSMKEGADFTAEAWYNRNSSSQTHEVGRKRPNLYGLYDVNGNVQEWCVNDDTSIKGEYLASGGAYDCEEIRLLMESVITANKGDRSSTCGFRLVLDN